MSSSMNCSCVWALAHVHERVPNPYPPSPPSPPFRSFLRALREQQTLVKLMDDAAAVVVKEAARKHVEAVLEKAIVLARVPGEWWW